MSIKFVRYKHDKGTLEPDANGEWVMWDDFASSRLNIKQMKKDRDDAEKRETLAANMAVAYLQRAEAAEAKLTKAVEALRYYAGASPIARAVLAELEGK
jgi:hypothetical protein